MVGDGSTRPGGGVPRSGRVDHDDAPGTLPPLTVRVRHALARALVRLADSAAWWARRLSADGDGGAGISGAQLRDLVAHSTALDREERRLIDEVLAAGDRHVRELMVPRTEATFLDARMSLADAVRVVRASGHSRFPVIDRDHDDVVGFVHLRDLLLRPAFDTARTVGELARTLRALPASKRALAALSEMRREGDHLALVVDEYGGTAGIVTLEDLLEELVGEIHDEYDAVPESEGTVPSEVDGLLNLSDFEERVGVALDPGPYDTVGGYLMARLGRLPALGDDVRVAGPGGEWRLTVVGMDGRRVARVGVVPVPSQSTYAIGAPAVAPELAEPVSAS